MNKVPANTVSAFRLPRDSPVFKGNKDPSAGPRTPHYYMGLAVSLWPSSFRFVLMIVSEDHPIFLPYKRLYDWRCSPSLRTHKPYV